MGVHYMGAATGAWAGRLRYSRRDGGATKAELRSAGTGQRPVPTDLADHWPLPH